MNRWDNEAIEYTEVDKIKAALIGRSIVNTISEGTDYDRVLSFILDNGTILKAHATDGGCACSNGCFTVEPGNVIRGTILNVEVKEYGTEWSDETEKEYPLGNRADIGAIRIFVYTELGESLLLSSEGGDNGYYGWGIWLSVHGVEPQNPETD